jgi:hypothetical protein
VQSVAAKRQLLCREAFHYKEHPANKAVAQLLQVEPRQRRHWQQQQQQQQQQQGIVVRAQLMHA